MVRLVLLTVAALFGVLALYGTPEFSGGNSEAVSQPVATVESSVTAVHDSQMSQPSIAPESLMQAALSPARTQQRRFDGPPLRPSPEYASTGALNIVTAGAARLYVTSDSVNLRLQPDQASGVIAKLRRGDALTPVATQNGPWIEVEASGERGFVSARYLSNRPPV